MPDKRREIDLQNTIVEWLNFQLDTFAWRMESNGIPVKQKDGKFIVIPNKSKFKPDVCGVKKGRGFVLEVKLPGKHPTDDQRQWMERYAGKGQGYAAVVHSIQEACECWDEI